MENKKLSKWIKNALLLRFMVAILLLVFYDWQLVVIFAFYDLSRNSVVNFYFEKEEKERFEAKNNSDDPIMPKPEVKQKSEFKKILEEMAKERSSNKS